MNRAAIVIAVIATIIIFNTDTFQRIVFTNAWRERHYVELDKAIASMEEEEKDCDKDLCEIYQEIIAGWKDEQRQYE